MKKQDIIFNTNQLMFVSTATPVLDLQSYVPVCDLPFSQKSVLPKGAVYEIGVWNKNRTKFMLLREFGKVVVLANESEKFEFKKFNDEFKNFKVRLSPIQVQEGISFDDITKENKILLRKNLQHFAEELKQKKGRSR